ncbi:Icc-related predicted phosphoesterase [Salinibacter ruber]|uniref:right-handed parallel beta-helix repeat-containing protein n=1 Tax=Salinibacter ruber TaxID=146919 RepID=UPI002169C794|nr:Icc-related predicted phosphoesterase [Salinibacter ruber]
MSGTLTEDTTFSSGDTTTVVGDLTIQAAVTLTIESGAIVEVDGNYAITVNGVLDANGTDGAPITITSGQESPSPDDWKGISFAGPLAESSVLEHVEIKYASTGISANGISNGAALQLQSVTIRQTGKDGLSGTNAVVEVTGGTVANVGNRGIYLNGGDTDVTIDGTTVEQDGAQVRSGSCVFVRNGAALTLTGSILRRCSVGLNINQTDFGDAPQTVTATGNTIVENRRGVVVAPRFCFTGGCNVLKYPSTLEIQENEIASNTDRAVEVGSGKNPRQTELDFTNNWWGTTDGVSIADRIKDRSDDDDVAFVEFLPMWDSPPGNSPQATRTGPDGQTFWNGRIKQARSWSEGDQPTLIGKTIFTADLTIEAGVTVKVVDDVLVAKGPLTATGTSDQPIKFTSNASLKEPGQWGGIVLEGGVQAGQVKHWEVRYARQGLSINSVQPSSSLQVQDLVVDSVSGTGVDLNQSNVSATDWSINSVKIGISITNAVVEVTGGTVANVGNRGIYLNGGDTDVTIDGTTVEQDGAQVRSGSCVFVRNGAALTLTGSILRRCSVGLNINQTDFGDAPQTVTATGNTIVENRRGVVVAPRFCFTGGCNVLKYPSTLEIQENEIASNTDRAVEVGSGKNPRQTELDFTNNWWGTTDGVSIADRIKDRSDDDDVAFVEFLPMWDSPPGNSPQATRTGPDGQTFWNGRIKQARSWRRSNSPHVAVGAVVLEESRSLTVEQGSEVQFLKNGLEARGSLVLQGTEDARVQMGLHESSPVDRWPGITLQGSGARASRLLHTTLQNVRTGVQVNSIPQVGQESYPQLEGLLVKNSGRGISIKGSRVDIRRSRIVNFGSEGVRVTGADADVEIFDESTLAQDGSRTRNGTCLSVQDRAKTVVQASTIAACNRGVNVYSQGSDAPDVEVSGSIVKRNSTGFRIDPKGGGDAYPEVVAVENDLLGNEDWNVRVEKGNKPGETTLDFTQNWWGTTDSADVAAKIRDSGDSKDLATVDFGDRRSEENGEYGLADINNDGRTDGFDLSILASAFGSVSGDENYNPDADLEADDRIDGFDLSLLGTRFGRLGATPLQRTEKSAPRLMAAGGDRSTVDYSSRPDSVLRAMPTRLTVESGTGPFVEGDTVQYRLRVENTPSLFAVSAQLHYEEGKMRFARGQTGEFLRGDKDASVIGLSEADDGQGALGLTRTRVHRHDSPSGSGHVATLQFVTRIPLEQVPSLGLSEVGLLAPDGRTAYETSVEGKTTTPGEPITPEEYALEGNYPNPFSRSTTLALQLPEEEFVTVEVYDTMGRRVKTIVSRRMKAGTHKLQFDAQGLASGTYFCRMRAEGKVSTTQMSVVR